MPKKAPWITKDVRIVEAMGWLTGACSVVLTGFAIAAVPTGEKVPVHYGVDMQPNRWGSPVELLLLPIVMLACIALLALVLHLVSPEHWNQPTGLESDEKDAWYLASARSVAWFELECGVFSLLAALNPLSDDCKAMIVGAVTFELLLIATPLIFTARFRKSRGKGKARKLWRPSVFQSIKSSRRRLRCASSWRPSSRDTPSRSPQTTCASLSRSSSHRRFADTSAT